MLPHLIFSQTIFQLDFSPFQPTVHALLYTIVLKLISNRVVTAVQRAKKQQKKGKRQSGGQF